jgi:transposase
MTKIKMRGRGTRPKERGYRHTKAFKLRLARLYFESNEGLVDIARAFNVPHQSISRWAKQYYCELSEEIVIPPMTEKEKKDVAALQQQLELLNKKLEYEKMKNFALETMIDLAKTELGVDVRKNSGAKQPKE